MKTSPALILFILLGTAPAFAQVGINPDGASPHPAAMLDVKSSIKGFLPPRMNTTQQNSIANPPAGLIIFNMTTKTLNLYDGTSWVVLAPANQSWVCGSPFTDYRDGSVYKTIQIGTQCWMRENMNIGTMVSGSEWQTNDSIFEKYCYDDYLLNCDVYGGLYMWNEMMQYDTTPGARGICPPGWHIPSDSEWTVLTTYLGGEATAGGPMKETGLVHWASPNTGATNSSGFTAIPGGYCDYGGSFYNITYCAYFFSSTQYDASRVYIRRVFYNNVNTDRPGGNKVDGCSCRCLRD